jgi:hypothetical protein
VLSATDRGCPIELLLDDVPTEIQAAERLLRVSPAASSTLIELSQLTSLASCWPTCNFIAMNVGRRTSAREGLSQ